MTQIAIFGSCVSRDPIQPLLDDNSISLTAYVSKTGVVSQTSEKTLFPSKIPVGTDFASRMVAMDINKTGIANLTEGKSNFYVFDFIDDRLPIIDIGESHYTASRFFENLFPDLVKLSSAPDNLFGTDKGTDLFLNRLKVFAASLRRHGITDSQIILHRAWWARAKATSGNTLEAFDNHTLKRCHAINSSLKKAYALFQDLFPESKKIEVNKERIIADVNHKWGCDPFHYIDSYNQEFRRQLTQITSEPKQATSLKNLATHLSRSQPKSEIRATHPENKRIVPDVGGYERKGDQRDPFCTAFGLHIPYLTHAKEWVAKFRDTGVVFDDDGVPLNNFRWGGPYRYSVTIGHHGLSEITRYQANADVEHFKNADRVCKWLLNNQNKNGAWQVDFDHDWFPPRCKAISSPWVSAMGQGLCLSTLSRVAHVTAQSGADTSSSSVDELCDAIVRAAHPFTVSSSAGGCRTMLLDKYPFYEEYPTKPSSYVLNGFMYSLLGLYDGAAITGDLHLKALYDEGMETLKAAIPLYDLGRATAYDLTHVSCAGFPPNTARYSYHFIHVQLLSAMNILSDGAFAPVLERWWLYLNGWGDRGN